MPLNRKLHQPYGAAPRLRDHHSAARWLTALLLAGAVPSFADEVPGVLLDGSYAFLGGPQFSLNGGGEQPVGRLARGPDGSFYGVTAGYGAGDADYGEISTPPTIFRIKPGPGGGFTTLHRFADTQAQGGYLFGPSDGLVRGTDGHYYGTTIGEIFRITADGTFSILHHFDPAGSEGFGGAALTLGRDGRLYGVTGGGAFGIFPNSLGGVIRVEADGQVTVLHRFTGAEGRALAIGNLLQARDGNFYGVTCCGGAAGAGSLFRITPAGDYTVLYAFPANQGGPKSPLVQGQDGDLYGSTQGDIDSEGEERAAGTVFRITAAGEVHTLHAFSVARGEDGIYPGGLVAGADGRIYGVARGGGRAGGGAVFRVDRDGRYEALYAFDGAHGAGPAAPLLEVGGKLYGSTAGGGAHGAGTLFKLDPGMVTVKLAALATTVHAASDARAILAWTAARASACVAGGDWAGNRPASGVAAVPTPAVGTRVYTLTCTGLNESTTARATVNVVP